VALDNKLIMNDALKMVWQEPACACFKVTATRGERNYENPQSGDEISGCEFENGTSQIYKTKNLTIKFSVLVKTNQHIFVYMFTTEICSLSVNSLFGK
jgi:hypothetical protein